MKNEPLPDSAIESPGHPSLLAPGAILQDRYRIVARLGSGGMGAVYEAVDQRLETTIALKETFSIDNRLRRQFEQEARLLARLDHPALPRVTDYFTEGDRAFLVMQFISGADLAQIIATQPGPFPRNQVIAWADQLLDALIYLHTRDRQVVHRDIKPHNLKLTASGQIALLDFGLAKAEAADASNATSSASIFGYTRRYSPLEQIQDQGTSPQSDIYALGATLYHLLTGVKPPDALARAAALAKSTPDPLRPAHEIHPMVGAEIAAILCRAMALSPEDRYETAKDFRESLRRVGRKENQAAKDAARHSIAKAGGDTTVNPTVIRQTRTAEVDPFDSYSILKPAEPAWLAPKPSRHPGVIAAVLTIMLSVGAGAFYGFSGWGSSGGIDPKVSVLSDTKAISARNESGTAGVRQNKPEKPRAGASGTVSVPAAVAGEASRKTEKQQRAPRRVINARSRAASLTPPPVSILP